MTVFSSRWDWAVSTAKKSLVQNRDELERLFNKIQQAGCSHYLEIGTAEGFSTYVLAGAMQPNSKILCVDFDEEKTREERKLRFSRLVDEGYEIKLISGNSSAYSTQHAVMCHVMEHGHPDVVMIDAGHTYDEVKGDYLSYGAMAKKMLVFHDATACKGVSSFLDTINQSGVWESWSEPGGFGYAVKHMGIQNVG